MRGSVTKYFNEKGFGFINCNNESIFFHISKIKNNTIPEAGNVVEFDIENGDRGKIAVNIDIVDTIPKTTFITFGNLRIKSSNIKTYGICDECQKILQESKMLLSTYYTIINNDGRDKILNEYGKISEWDKKFVMSGSQGDELKKIAEKYYLINQVENSIFQDRLYRAQKGILKYLYLTTYQGDNYTFYMGECGFDIELMVNELDTIL